MALTYRELDKAMLKVYRGWRPEMDYFLDMTEDKYCETKCGKNFPACKAIRSMCNSNSGALQEVGVFAPCR